MKTSIILSARPHPAIEATSTVGRSLSTARRRAFSRRWMEAPAAAIVISPGSAGDDKQLDEPPKQTPTYAGTAQPQYQPPIQNHTGRAEPDCTFSAKPAR